MVNRLSPTWVIEVLRQSIALGLVAQATLVCGTCGIAQGPRLPGIFLVFLRNDAGPAFSGD